MPFSPYNVNILLKTHQSIAACSININVHEMFMQLWKNAGLSPHHRVETQEYDPGKFPC